ncbi:Gustatory Receptor [Nesidiocoris tenuis]|uniref:Gustatory receptor n=1 Tax=Nesidiocoris tenuis TaxID=355587 RepID=A0ABN7AZY8_9HEMI|nr:Gustatory Receptor [Nesidiocoris tenuis]
MAEGVYFSSRIAPMNLLKLKTKRDENRVYGIFKFPLKWTGLMAFRVETSGRRRVSWWSLAVGHLMTFSSIGVPLYFWFAIPAVEGSGRSSTAVVVTWIDRIVSFITSANLLVTANIQLWNVARLEQSLEHDWEVIYLQKSAATGISAMRYWAVPSVSVFMLCVVSLECGLGNENVYHNLPLCYLRIIEFLSEIMFVAPVLALGDQFCHLNSRMGRCFDQTHPGTIARVLPFVEFPSKDYGRMVNFDAQDELRTLSAIHWKLCSVGSHINATFSCQLLVLFVSLFVNVITRPYFIFLSFNDPDVASETMDIVRYSGWVVLYALQLWLLVWPCSRARDEAAHTSTVIVQRLNKPIPLGNRKMLEQFLVQLMNHKLTFTVYNLFTLDLSVLTSVAGAVTTYLVILIQFQKSDAEGAA